MKAAGAEKAIRTFSALVTLVLLASGVLSVTGGLMLYIGASDWTAAMLPLAAALGCFGFAANPLLLLSLDRKLSKSAR